MATTFSEAIRTRRLALGMKQRDVAERVGISIPYLSDMEQGRRDPPPNDRITALAATLKLPADYLLFFARRLPEAMPQGDYEPGTITAAYDAMRRVLKRAASAPTVTETVPLTGDLS